MSNPDPYFNRSEVSNSDLSFIKSYWEPNDVRMDKEKAYRFGTLVDAVITEPERVDFLNYTVDDVQYSRDEFEQARAMKRSFMQDSLCAKMLEDSLCQKVMSRSLNLNYGTLNYNLEARCKWDLWMPKFDWGGDIKSTTARTEKQFIEACYHFDYDRQRAWYMDIAGSRQDILIGISKVNMKVFKIPIQRVSDFYLSGRDKYEELSFKYWYLFGDMVA